MDLELETIRISNDSDDAVSMKGYRLCDANEFHWYEFPETFVLPARHTVVVHCCPGKESSLQYLVHGARPVHGPDAGSSHEETRNTPSEAVRRKSSSDGGGSPIHLQWTNKDGSLRRKNVLNDDEDEIFLFDGASECLSHCYRARGKPSIVTRYTSAGHAATLLSRARLACAYVRILSLIFGVYASATEAQRLVVWVMTSILFDIIGRCFYVRTLRLIRENDPLVESMNSLADRLHTIVMCIKLFSLVVQFSCPIGDALHLPAFITTILGALINAESLLFLLMLEIASHWMRNCAESLLPVPVPRLDDARRRLLSQVYADHGVYNGNPTGPNTATATSTSASIAESSLSHHQRTPAGRPASVPVSTGLDRDTARAPPSTRTTAGTRSFGGIDAARRAPLTPASVVTAPPLDSPFDRSTPLLVPHTSSRALVDLSCSNTTTTSSNAIRSHSKNSVVTFSMGDSASGHGINGMDFVDRVRENFPPLITFITLMHEIALVSIFASLSDVESPFTGEYFSGNFGLLRLGVFGLAIVGKVIFLLLQLWVAIRMVASDALVIHSDPAVREDENGGGVNTSGAPATTASTRSGSSSTAMNSSSSSTRTGHSVTGNSSTRGGTTNTTISNSSRGGGAVDPVARRIRFG